MPDHPGLKLKAIMRKKNYTFIEVSVLTTFHERHLESVVRGKRRVSTALAIQLGLFTDIKPEEWLAMQSEWDLFQFGYRKAGA